MDFAGTTIEWRGFLRSENVSEYMGLWMRQDGDTPNLAFATMQPRQIRGTNDWTEYSITLPFHRDGKQLYFGVLLGGTGKVWADDLRCWSMASRCGTPRRWSGRKRRSIGSQFEQVRASASASCRTAQIENLAMLGKVWGFLKYHHPAVTSGTRHWDYELFACSRLLAARDRQSGDRVLLDWTRRFWDATAGDSCVAPTDENVHLRTDRGWMDTGLSSAIWPTSSARFIAAVLEAQFYVSQVPNIGNPQFDHELPYASLDQSASRRRTSRRTSHKRPMTSTRSS